MADQPAPIFTPEQVQMIQALQAQQQPQQPFQAYPATAAPAQQQAQPTPPAQEDTLPEPNLSWSNAPPTATGEIPISMHKGQPIQALQQQPVPSFKMPATVNQVPMSTIQQMMPRPNPELVAAQMRMLQAIKQPAAMSKPIAGMPLVPSTARTF